MKIPCEIIQDLLPSYIDKLTNETTNREVEGHLDECEGCGSLYQDMTKELQVDEESAFERDLKKLSFLANMKRKSRIILAVAVVTVVILMTLLTNAMNSGYTIPLDQIKVEEIYGLEEGMIFVAVSAMVTDREEIYAGEGYVEFAGEDYGERENAEVTRHLELTCTFKEKINFWSKKEKARFEMLIPIESAFYRENGDILLSMNKMYLGDGGSQELLWEEGDQLKPAPQDIQKRVVLEEQSYILLDQE